MTRSEGCRWPLGKGTPGSVTSTASALSFSSLAHFWDYHYGQHGLLGLRIFLPTLLVLGTWIYLRRSEKYGRLASLAAALTVFFTLLYVFGSFMPVLKLMQKYANVPMSLADGCLVRMSEALSDSLILTTDTDFRIYRRHSRQVVPCLIPE